jgi:hypothetical protein
LQLRLNLTHYQDLLEVKQEDGKRWLRDPIRNKWLVLLPEEMVRQLLIHYLIDNLGVNKNRITIERGLTVNGLQKRCDILIFDRAMQPWLLVECKAPSVRLKQSVFRQIATYNMPLQVPYLLVCNGPEAYACSIDFAEETFEFLSELPTY